MCHNLTLRSGGLVVEIFCSDTGGSEADGGERADRKQLSLAQYRTQLAHVMSRTAVHVGNANRMWNSSGIVSPLSASRSFCAERSAVA